MAPLHNNNGIFSQNFRLDPSHKCFTGWWTLGSLSLPKYFTNYLINNVSNAACLKLKVIYGKL